MPYLHLPFQSGSDRILAAMNRKHTARDYLRLVDRIRAARPDIALSTDIIVGFPGETEAEFEATLDVSSSASASRRPTRSSTARGPARRRRSMDDQVPEAVKTERLHRLQELLERQQTAFNAACVGKTLPVLFERRGRHAGQLVGRSPYLQSVHAEADASTAWAASCRLKFPAAGPNSLSGVITAEPDIRRRCCGGLAR